jgi:ferredoxin
VSAVRIQADQDVCTGSGKCVMIAPNVFDQGDDGLVVVLDPEPGGRDATDAREAVELCPVQALRFPEFSEKG